MANHGFITGNLASAPKFFENKDGSRTAYITVYTAATFPNSKGEFVDHAVALEKFLPANSKTKIYNALSSGDAVEISYHLEQDSYTKNGERVFALKAKIDSLTFAPRGRGKKQAGNNTNAAAQKSQEQAPVTVDPVQAPAQAQAPAVNDDPAAMDAAVV